MLDTAVYTARQRAATWDNSSKNIEDGYLPSFNGDGLYWRIFNDLGGSLVLNGSEVKNGGSPLVQEKIRDLVKMVNSRLAQGVFKSASSEINVRYKNMFLKRTVSVSINENIIIPLNWLANILDTRLSYKADADVAEPVEYIRNFDLAQKYSNQLLNNLQNIPGVFKSGKEGNSQPRSLVASRVKGSGRQVNVYHYPGCKYISQIKDVNLIEFATAKEANSAGYYMCWRCAKNMAD